MRSGAICIIAALLLRAGHPPTVTVAAAANLSEVFQTVGAQFEASTGIRPVFSFGSTAQLTQQIENGAPYDLFAAADAAHVDQLEREGKLAAGSKEIYATGVLALWIPSTSRAKISRAADLTSPDVRVIAVARPELAPYGAATVESLQRLGIWEQVKAKVVYGASISMVKQYGRSGNADAVFTSYSLVLKESGKVLQIDEKLHQPIAQALGVMAASPHQSEARKFSAFLLKGKGREILATQGYRIPE
jgi:molybdate transport system substrate-binding protein